MLGLSRQSLGLWAGLASFFLILLLPAPAGMGDAANKTAAVAALMICWWVTEAVNIGVTGLVPLAAIPLLGVESSQAVSARYANHLIFLFIGGFIIAQAMERWNLHRRIALNIIVRFGSRPRPIVLGFMVATAVLSMWISNTATTMMLLPMAMAVVNQLVPSAKVRGVADGQPSEQVARDTFGSVLLLGIAYAASIGGIGTVVGSPTTVAFLGFANEALPDLPQITFAQWSMVALPIVAVFLPVTWVYLCRFGARAPLSAVRFESSQDVVRSELASMGPMSVPQKRVLAIASATGTLWILRAPLQIGAVVIPGWSSLFPQPGAVHDSTVAMAMALLLFGVPSGASREDGTQRLLAWRQVARGTPWGIVFLIGGGFALAGAITGSGLAGWVGQSLGALAGLPEWLLVVCVCVLVTTMTETTSNVATVLMLSPVVTAMCAELGVHPYLLLLPMAVTASFAFALPVATPPNAIIFSSRWITIPQMARAGVALDVIGLLIVPLAVYALGTAALGI